MWLRNQRSAILIVSLWILAILVVFCLGLGYRMNLHLKITRFYQDKLKARALLEAGLLRIIEEKKIDQNDADYLSEDWSSKKISQEIQEPYFKDFPLGEGSFTISYEYRESKDAPEPTTFYGLQDEQAKFNINKILGDTERQKQFTTLLSFFKTELPAEDLRNNLLDWIDVDDEGLGYPNRSLSNLEELQLVPGFSKEFLYTYDKNEDGIIDSTEIGLMGYITIYGEDGKVNINTASFEVLNAIFKTSGLLGNIEEFVKQLVFTYRFGSDNLPDGELDGVVNKWEDLRDLLAVWYGSSWDASTETLAYNLYGRYLTSTSSAYRAKIEAQVKRQSGVSSVKKNLEAVLKIDTSGHNILYWYEN